MSWSLTALRYLVRLVTKNIGNQQGKQATVGEDDIPFNIQQLYDNLRQLDRVNMLDIDLVTSMNFINLFWYKSPVVATIIYQYMAVAYHTS